LGSDSLYKYDKVWKDTWNYKRQRFLQGDYSQLEKDAHLICVKRLDEVAKKHGVTIQAAMEARRLALLTINRIET
jgi:hypothetical protein